MQQRHRKRKRLHIKANILSQLIKAQQVEMTEHLIYSKLSEIIKDKKNKKVLERIASEEQKHATVWQKYTNRSVAPNKLYAEVFIIISRIFGLTFGVKLLEKNEATAQINYSKIEDDIPEAKVIIKEEEEHEKALINLINEENLKYIGSMVLGVNDALVELTGALAGLTLVLQNGKLIAITGLITGIAASFSMAASEYLSTKSESQDKDPLKAAVYTGIMYLVTVFFLIIPYFLLNNVLLSLSITLTFAIIIIALFTFYISIAKDLSFKRRFLEMAGISLGVSILTFFIGYIVRIFIGIEV